MERLTNKFWRNFDPWECCGQDKYCMRGLDEEGGCINGCKVPKLYRRLAEYEDAEEQGLLLRLPCKEGTEVYLTDYPNNRFVLKEYKFIGMTVVMVLREFIHGSQCTRWVGDIGKTVFLTKEEAEKKLASMQKGE